MQRKPNETSRNYTTITIVVELLLWGMEEGRWPVEEPGLGLGQAWGTSA